MGFGRTIDLPKKKQKNKKKKLDPHIVNRLRDSQSDLQKMIFLLMQKTKGIFKIISFPFLKQ